MAQRTSVDYYLRELEWLRNEGATFATQYPNIAARLDISSAESSDPQVERLVESFAFLTGRVNRNIDQDFVEIPLALLTIMSPHLANPMPSMGVVRFQPRSGANVKEVNIPKGTALQSDVWEGVPCKFTTCYPLKLLPLNCSGVYSPPPKSHQHFAGALKITVSGARTYLTAANVPDELRFHLGGDPVRAASVYDHLSQHLGGIVLALPGGTNQVTLPPANLRFHGLGDVENALPLMETAMPSHRLLLEYFAFPEKFFFFSIRGLSRRPRGETLEIYLLFNKPLETHGSDLADLFRLNCVPVVNLYRAQGAPFFLDGRQYEHRLMADASRDRTTEVYSVEGVELHFPGKPEPLNVKPYFGFGHSMEGSGEVYWWARRTPCSHAQAQGVDTFLCFVGLDFSKIGVRQQFVSTQLFCSNRDVVQKLEAGSPLSMSENIGAWSISFLSRPSSYYPCLTGGDLMWRMVAHMGSSYISFSDPKWGLGALRDFLRLLSVGDPKVVERLLTGLVDMRTSEVAVRSSSGSWRGFRPGVRVELSVDPTAFVGVSLSLFEKILAQVFEDGRGVNRVCEFALGRREQ